MMCKPYDGSSFGRGPGRHHPLPVSCVGCAAVVSAAPAAAVSSRQLAPSKSTNTSEAMHEARPRLLATLLLPRLPALS